MTLFLLSFFAGVLTVLAPCVLPLLPVIVGSTATEKNLKKVSIITISLGVSIFLFTLLLKASTLLIDISPSVWKFISGGIITALGIVTVFPHIWETISLKLNFSTKANKAFNESSDKKGYIGSILTGAALGPVFSSCSPTYALILATILPVSFFKGLIYLLAYSAGLSLVMFLIGFFGQTIVRKLKWASNPNGKFKRILGIIFILLGIAIMLGFDKKFETYLVQNQVFDATKIEGSFLKDL